MITNRTKVVRSNPLKADPTRSATLRRIFVQDLTRRFSLLKTKMIKLIVEEDAFGIQQKSQTLVKESKRTSNVLDNGICGIGSRISGRYSLDDPVFQNGNGEHLDAVLDRNVTGIHGGIDSGSIRVSADRMVPVANTRWKFLTDSNKVEAYRKWLETQIAADIITTTASNVDKAYWTKYVEQGYTKGAGRAFDDVKKPMAQSNLDFFSGTKQEFLRQSFAQPEAVDKVKLLAGRVFTELKGVTDVMAQQMTRELVEGFVQGENARVIARRLSNRIDKIGKARATVIARTEVIRAHAEGQLDALEDLGVTEVGVAVEWSTAGDDRVCPLCQPLEGVVLKIKEARGILPRHPQCRCAYIPANIGEPPTGQKRDKTSIDQAVDRSIKAERPKRSKRTLAQQKAISRWPGADKKIIKGRPKSILDPPRKRGPKPGSKRTVKPKPTPSSTIIKPATKPSVTISKPRPTLKPKKFRVLKESLDKVSPEISKEFKQLVKERALVSKKIKSGLGSSADIERAAVIKDRLATLRTIIRDNESTVTTVPKIKIPIKKKPRKVKLDPLSESELERFENLESLHDRRKFLGELNPEQAREFNLLKDRFEGAEQIRLSAPITEKLAANKDLDDIIEKIASIEFDKVEDERLLVKMARAHIRKTEVKNELEQKATDHFATRARLRQDTSIPRTDPRLRTIFSTRDDAVALDKELVGLEKALIEDAKKRVSLLEKPTLDAYKLLKVAKKDRMIIKTNPQNVSRLIKPKSSSMTVAKVGGKFKGKAKKAERWLSNITAKQEKLPEFEVRAYRLPNFGDDSRAFQRTSDFESLVTGLTYKDGVYLTEADSVSIYIHEIVHRLENQSKRGIKLSREFLDYRIAKAGTKTVKLDKQFPGWGFKVEETGNEDSFLKAFSQATKSPDTASSYAFYTGKNYGNTATEVMTMGVQLLHEDPIGFAKRDKEFMKFILGSLKRRF